MNDTSVNIRANRQVQSFDESSDSKPSKIVADDSIQIEDEEAYKSLMGYTGEDQDSNLAKDQKKDIHALAQELGFLEDGKFSKEEMNNVEALIENDTNFFTLKETGQIDPNASANKAEGLVKKILERYEEIKMDSPEAPPEGEAEAAKPEATDTGAANAGAANDGDATRASRADGTSEKERAGAERRANRDGGSSDSSTPSAKSSEMSSETPEMSAKSSEMNPEMPAESKGSGMATEAGAEYSKPNEASKQSVSSSPAPSEGKGPGWDALPGHKKNLGYTAKGEGAQMVNIPAKGNSMESIPGISQRAFNFAMGFGGADGFGGDSHDRDHAAALGFTYDSGGPVTIQDVFKSHGNDGSAHISKNGQRIAQEIFKKADEMGFLNDNHLTAAEIAQLMKK